MKKYDKDCIYGGFASVYDTFMDNAPYKEWCERIVRLINEYGVSRPQERNAADKWRECAEQEDAGQEFVAEEQIPERAISDSAILESAILESERNLMVDLGCGTGTLTQMLYKKGYDMIGVDNSEEMLNVAMEKREQEGDEILYLLQDMRELELYSTVGTVVSVCDSVNYILEEDELLDTFKLVNNYLYPGGIFIFDFNTVYKYEHVIGDTTIAENRDDCSFIWENFYHSDEEINEYDLTVFVQEEGDRFRRFTETHYQRGYTAEQMTALVEEAGMKVLLVKDSDTDGPVTENSQRIYLVAREQGKEEKNV